MIQTNRVLLIEEIAPNKENIVSTVNYIEQREGLSDEEINEYGQGRIRLPTWRSITTMIPAIA